MNCLVPVGVQPSLTALPQRHRRGSDSLPLHHDECCRVTHNLSVNVCFSAPLFTVWSSCQVSSSINREIGSAWPTIGRHGDSSIVCAQMLSEPK